jgi:hypothetical protein
MALLRSNQVWHCFGDLAVTNVLVSSEAALAEIVSQIIRHSIKLSEQSEVSEQLDRCRIHS